MLSGIIINNDIGHQYNFQPLNLENPVQGVRVTCLFNSKQVGKVELRPQNIKTNRPSSIHPDCFCAAYGIYKDLQDRGIKPDNITLYGENCSFFSIYEGNFIYNKIIKELYLPALFSSPDFDVVTSPNGKYKTVWNNKASP
ncbi:hypothetical protein J7438_08560 [Thalassotalea sp. G20_0]|uniref:hypothetical protein n=1 Tax=Thalassotalea sp. G20_0 TaxID=2821093 RepID=UPI001ADC3E4B|nr:hypothetical protein [Thalassotalea sp. G20_0]MBO9494137.1 hypothetical protein [Thalassotalea sp. G20_0]